MVNLVYLSARHKYRIEREDRSGKGYVDFIFYPVNMKDDCIILELKIDRAPESAIAQIKERQYALRFKGRLGKCPNIPDGFLLWASAIAGRQRIIVVGLRF